VVSEVLNSWKWTTKTLPYHVSIIIIIIAQQCAFSLSTRVNTLNLPLLLARRISTATQALVKIYTTDRFAMWRWRGERTAGVPSEAMCRSIRAQWIVQIIDLGAQWMFMGVVSHVRVWR